MVASSSISCQILRSRRDGFRRRRNILLLRDFVTINRESEARLSSGTNSERHSQILEYVSRPEIHSGVLTSWQTYLILVFMISSNIPNGGITVFFTQLIQGYGFDANTTFLLSMPGGAVEVISGLGFPWLARKFNNRMLMAAAAMCAGLFGISLMMGLERDGLVAHRIGQLFGYYMIIGNSATALILVLSNISSNTAGHTKKTTVNAVSLIGYCLGFLIGPQTFRDGPHYTTAKWNIIAMWLIAFLTCIAIYIVNYLENRKRDMKTTDLPPQPEGQEFMDLTDKENPYFRYAL